MTYSLTAPARLAAALVLMLLIAAPAGAGEKTDTQGLSSDAARLVKAYLAKSGPALDKLVGIVERGVTKSGDAWTSTCNAVDGSLQDLRTSPEIAAKLGPWVVNETRAWARMRTIGRAIAIANEEITARTDLMEYSNRISKDELKTTTSQITDIVSGMIEAVGAEIEDVTTASGNIDNALSAGFDEDSSARQISGLFGTLQEQVEDINEKVEQVERLEYWLRRFGDSIRRRKLDFFESNERIVSQLRRDLAKLTSAKIDPDGRGNFARVESRIEERAESNLDKFEAAVKEWEDVNKPFLTNAREFAIEFVAPAVEDAIKDLPKTVFGVGVPGWAWKPDMELDDAVDGWRDWIVTQYERFTGKYYERLANTVTTWEEDLRLLDRKEKDSLKEVDQQRGLTVDDFKEAAEKEIARFKSWADSKRRAIQQLAKDKDDERRRLENEVDMYEKEAKAESVALEKRIERHDRRVADQKKELSEAFEKKRAELQKAIREMKAAKAGVK